MRRIDLTKLALLALAIGLATGACAKKSSTTTETPSTTPASNTSTSAPVTVTTVDLGRTIGGDKRIAERVDVFRPSDTIYASVLTAGMAPAATLKARWTFEDGQVVDESEQTIAPTGDSATEFHISKPDGLPAGKYRVEIQLDGTTVQTKDFEVRTS